MSAPTVNKSLAIILADPRVKLVEVAYEGLDPNGHPVNNNTKLAKTIDHTLAKGDLVMVPTNSRTGFTVVAISKVDVTPDFDSLTPVGWVAGKVDQSVYQKITEHETKFLAIYDETQRKRREDELRQQFMNAMPRDAETSLPVIEARPAVDAGGFKVTGGGYTVDAKNAEQKSS